MGRLSRYLSRIGQITGLKGDPFLHRLVKNAGWLLSGSSIALMLGLVTTALRARGLGLQDFGLLALVGAYGSIVGRLATLQPWLSVIRYGAAALEKDDLEEFVGVIRLGLVLDLIGLAVAVPVSLLGAFFVMPHFGWDTTAVQLAAVSTFTSALSTLTTPVAVLRVLNRFHLLATQTVLTSALGLALALIIYLTGGGIWGFLLAQIAGQFVGAVFLFVSAWRAMRRRRLPSLSKARAREWRPVVSFSFWTFLTSTIQLPVKQFDVMLVGSLISVEMAGVYKVIKQVVSTLAMLTDPVYHACYPQFASEVGAGRASNAVRYAIRLGLILLVVIIPIVVVLGGTSTFWLPAVFGEAYGIAATPLAWFLGFAVLGFAANPVHPLFNALGFARTATAVSLVVNGIYVAAAVLLGSRLGLIGFALAYGLQLATEAGLKALVIRRRRSQWALAESPAT